MALEAVNDVGGVEVWGGEVWALPGWSVWGAWVLGCAHRKAVPLGVQHHLRRSQQQQEGSEYFVLSHEVSKGKVRRQTCSLTTPLRQH